MPRVRKLQIPALAAAPLIPPQPTAEACRLFHGDGCTLCLPRKSARAIETDVRRELGVQFVPLVHRVRRVRR